MIEPDVIRPLLCHVLHSLDHGGAEKMAVRCALDCEQKFGVMFVCLDEIGSMGEELLGGGFTVEVLGRRPGFDFRCSRRLSQILAERGVDLIHAHQYAPFFYSSLARLSGPSPPIVFTEHGREYPDYRRLKRVIANRILFRSSDSAVGVGGYVRSALIMYEGLPEAQTRVIYNGIDPCEYDPGRSARTAVRRQLNIGQERLVVVQVARLDRLKDHATAVRAIARAQEFIPDLDFVIVGEGAERSSIVRLVKELDLQQRVHLVGFSGDVASIIQAADIFLLSSISEGIPLVLMEAMATSLPCIATRVGGVSEVVAQDETGILVDPGSPELIATALRTLARSPKLRMKMGEAGRSRVIRYFDQALMGKAYDSLYKEILSA